MSDFPSVVRSSVRCMDDGIVHSSSSSSEAVPGRSQYRPGRISPMVPGIVYSWSWTILLDELEMYQFFATLSSYICKIKIPKCNKEDLISRKVK